MPVNPRMGISYSNSCTSTMKYYPFVFFKQHLCECISLRNPLDYFSSRTYWRVSGQLHLLLFALSWKKQTVSYPSCALGPELNSNFRNIQQPQAGLANVMLCTDTSLQQPSLSPSYGTHCWMALGEKGLWPS